MTSEEVLLPPSSVALERRKGADVRSGVPNASTGLSGVTETLVDLLFEFTGNSDGARAAADAIMAPSSGLTVRAAFAGCPVCGRVDVELRGYVDYYGEARVACLDEFACQRAYGIAHPQVETPLKRARREARLRELPKPPRRRRRIVAVTNPAEPSS